VCDLAPQALVFEMFGPDKARGLTPDIRENAIKIEAALNWHDSGWPDFAMYYPIFSAAPKAAIFGGAFPRAEVRQAVTDGAAKVFGDSAPLFGIDQPLPANQQATRETLQFEAHCEAMPLDMMSGMVEAQRLRDAGLARATIAAFEHARATSDSPQVVVITGNGHAREDWGMPAMLRLYYANQPEIDIRTLAQFEAETEGDVPYSSSVITKPAEREDPCAAFKK